MLCAVVSTLDGLLVSEPSELSPTSFSERINSLANGQGLYLIAEVDGLAVGHASLWPMGLGKVSYVLRVLQYLML
jgi:hypothetical protein